LSTPLYRDPDASIEERVENLLSYGEPLKAEIEAGRVPLEVVDTAVRRVLRLKFQLGLFENPYVDAEAANAAFQTPEQRALARQAVAESTILLTNDGVLPLAPTVKCIAVIGPGADDERLLQGDYHYPAHLEIINAAPQDIEVAAMNTPQASGKYMAGPYFTPHVTPLAGLRSALGNDAEVGYAKGCEVLGDDRSGFAEAVQVFPDKAAGREAVPRPTPL
jgi:beta-glucosidase